MAWINSARANIEPAHAGLIALRSLEMVARDAIKKVEPGDWDIPLCCHDGVCTKCRASVMDSLFEFLEYKFRVPPGVER